MKKVFLIALVAFSGTAAFAQDAPPVQQPATTTPAAPPPEPELPVELAIDYSFLHSPQNGFIPGFSLNGVGASLAFYFNKHLGIHADFQDYGTHSLSFSVPAMSQPCSGLSDCPLSVKGTAFSYMAGPIVRFRVKRRFEPFVEVMFGGAHDNTYAAVYKGCFNQGQCVNPGKLPNNNAFVFALGGGLDVPLKEHISIRLAQVDYEPTRFGNSLKPNNGHANIQSNFRFQAGIVFKF